jgi:hypothetical protein
MALHMLLQLGNRRDFISQQLYDIRAVSIPLACPITSGDSIHLRSLRTGKRQRKLVERWIQPIGKSIPGNQFLSNRPRHFRDILPMAGHSALCKRLPAELLVAGGIWRDCMCLPDSNI